MNESTIYQYVKSQMKNRDKLINNLNKKYADIVQGEFQFICDAEVGKFYDSYDPIYYGRIGDLYDISKVNVDVAKNEMSVDFDYSVLSGHRLKDFDTFGEYMFENGWHGGAPSAKKGPKHPHTGVPYWRTKFNFSEWGDPAVVSDSIYENIMSALEEKGKDLMNLMQSEYNEIINDYKENVIKAINAM